MPQPIGRYPSGLLGLLNSKSRGQTPAEANDALQLVSDISPFYLQNARRRLTGTTSLMNFEGSWGAVGVGPGRGQIAYVWACSATVSANLAAGTTYKLAMQYNIIDEAAQVMITPWQAYGAGERVSQAGPQGFWLPENTQLGVRVIEFTAGTAVQADVLADLTLIDL